MSESSLQAQLLFDAKARLGEGPVWDQARQQLYWVDIEGCRLHRHVPSTNTNDAWELGEMAGAVFPFADGTLLLALESGFARFDTGSGELVRLDLLRNTDKNMRFNDGKFGPRGTLWIGSMHKALQPHAGALYRINTDLESTVMIPDTTVSNGMAWSADQRFFYYVDTAAYQLWRFNYDAARASLSNKKILFSIPKAYGGADGMTIDREGKLWIAHWGGHCVRRWDPETGQVLQTIAVAAPHVTSCCFGGGNLDMLYITTARSGLDAGALEQYPGSGGLFRCPLEVTGFPTPYVELTL